MSRLSLSLYQILYQRPEEADTINQQNHRPQRMFLLSTLPVSKETYAYLCTLTERYFTLQNTFSFFANTLIAHLQFLHTFTPFHLSFTLADGAKL